MGTKVSKWGPKFPNRDFQMGTNVATAVHHLWGRLGVLLQRGNAAILGNRIPSFPPPHVDGVMEWIQFSIIYILQYQLYVPALHCLWYNHVCIETEIQYSNGNSDSPETIYSSHIISAQCVLCTVRCPRVQYSPVYDDTVNCMYDNGAYFGEIANLEVEIHKN